MYGLQLIRLLDVLPITSVDNAPGVSPRSLIVKGTNFKNVETVLVNGFASPMFIAYSDTELVAEVPAEIATSVITDVAVLSAIPSYTGRSLVNLTVGTKIRRVSGTQRLVQNFVRLLLRSPGSNIFHKTSGGGLPRRIGTTLDSRVAADISLAIGNVKQEIIKAQTPVRAIPLDERLLSASIANLSIDHANASVYVTLVLTSHAGAQSAATLIV